MSVLERFANWLAAGRVPEPRRLVGAGGGDDLSRGTESDRPDFAVVRQGFAERLAGGRIPAAGAADSAAGQQSFAVGAKGRGLDFAAVLVDREQMKGKLAMRCG